MINRITALSIEKVVEFKNEELLNFRNLLIDHRVSNYPIFIFQKHSKEILGKKIMDERQNEEQWNIYISHLEELYSKKVIEEDKLNDFMLHYKNNNDHFCVLFIDQAGEAGFAFLPINYI